MAPHPPLTDALEGLLLGTAVGDAIGLPFEGMRPERIARLCGDRPLRHRLLFGRGLVSDDTEHAFLLGRSLLDAPDDAAAFRRALAGRLRLWLLALPPGIGLGTLRALLKLCVGLRRSGVRSAGNGPAMRAPLLGAWLPREALNAYVRASTRITHVDDRAEEGALVVALGTRLAVAAYGPPAPVAVLDDIDPVVQGDELREGLALVRRAVSDGLEPSAYAEAAGARRGISGYVNHTVPAALYCWLAAADFEDAVTRAVRLGGDTDTVGAIAGALAGASWGASAIPRPWLDGLVDHPISVARLRALAHALATRDPAAAPAWPWPLHLLRNLAFIPLVLAHGFRRLLPPYH